MTENGLTGVISDHAIREAADELRSVAAVECGRLAARILGQSEPGSPEWLAEQDARGTPEWRARLQEWHLVKVQIEREANIDPTGDVFAAHHLGATWAAIGQACGITRQSAYDRWGAPPHRSLTSNGQRDE